MFYMRDGGNLVVCNVNPGYERTNPWVLNLRSQPQAFVQIDGERRSYHAHEASETEIERLWPRLTATWPGYQAFYARSGQRAIFILEPDLR